ncbi:OmpW/AlkL family protein [Dinoroseobacter sp. S76]|uniref:OmpW/AlkL family protein n=1 Tax=Dinoroseobacter sp. S76 TaxID=3415124 RepID=UPI003C7A1206
MKKITLSALAVLAATAAAPAFAQEAGDWTIGIGIANVNPKSDNGDLAGMRTEIDDDTQLSFTAEYFFTPNIGVEILAATPFSHDIDVGNGAVTGETKHLPPTVSLNYHFTNFEGFTPFVGVGLNYTTFFEESSSAGKLELDDSFGLAAQVGVDIAVSETAAIRLNARYIDIDTDVKLNGNKVGTAEIDPVVLGIAYVMTF